MPNSRIRRGLCAGIPPFSKLPLATNNLTVFDQIGHSISSAGLITFAQTSSRQVQFALKVIW